MTIEQVIIYIDSIQKLYTRCEYIPRVNNQDLII